MVLSWNESKESAVNFSNEGQNTSKEKADAKPFLVEFSGTKSIGYKEGIS